MCFTVPNGIRRHMNTKSEKKKELARIRGRARYARNPSDEKSRVNKHREKLKSTVKNLLGGTCECCGEAELEFLTVDHTNQDGGGLKRKGWFYTYSEIKRAFDSEDPEIITDIKKRFRILCWNCNMSARNSNGVCSHRRSKRPQPKTYGGKRMRERFQYAKAALGGECVCCGENKEEFLSIDHIHNDGSKERRIKEGLRYTHTYYLKVESAFRWGSYQDIKDVLERYQLMCHKCNQSKARGKECLHRRHYTKHPEYPYADRIPIGMC